MRSFWIFFGVATHVLFAVTVWYLYGFLRGEPFRPPGGTLWVDVALAALFAVSHSALLLPGVRHVLERFIPAPLYGCFFCTVTCLSLLLTIGLWRSHEWVVWRATGTARAFVEAGFFASWALLFHSLYLTGWGYQTGWTPWWHWLRGRPVPKRMFEPRGVYGWMRHPVYLSFLGLLWFTPVVTLDRALLIALWTVYVFVGSWLKDRRLVYFLGATYRDYQSRVPGYPGLILGPLGKIVPPRNQPSNE